jgi:predicted transcriptional regulator
MTGKPVPIRLEDDLIDRLDRLATAMTARAAGAKVPRTSAMRIVLERGLEVLEAEMGLTARRPKPKPKRK